MNFNLFYNIISLLNSLIKAINSMDYFRVIGQKKLSGEVKISGAKNAALPLLALSILSKNSITIKNLPVVNDIKTMLKLISNLGSEYEFLDKNVVKINTLQINNTKATYDIVKTMRASILVLGPLLARFGHCEVSLPGGCAIGARPVDQHLKALEQMGATIDISNGYIVAKAPKDGLNGAEISFDKISVTGTENIIMAAALANGITKITNAAKEPEVVNLCEELIKSGVKIEGVGSDTLIIYGSSKKLLDIKDIKVIPDRIEAGTFLCISAITNSSITLNNVNPTHLTSVISKLKEMGLECENSLNSIKTKPSGIINSTNLITSEYPGFPTDMQAQFMAVLSISNGVSIIEERLFENRFMHANELIRMGAKITLNDHTATITGSELIGTDVMATDLRAGSALVIAALCASGESKIHRIYHLDRGYEEFEIKLSKIGADITRLSE